jgi:hypothetical protein
VWSDILEVVELENSEERIFYRRFGDTPKVFYLKLILLTNLMDFCDICLIICQSAISNRDDGGRLYMLAPENLLY